MKKLLTLCLIHQDSKVLLGMKKRGFGSGRWNGFGGKVMPSEIIEDAMRRETREEAGIEVKKATKIGILEFLFQDNPDLHEVHVFNVNEFSGTPTETDEMRPQWFHTNEIPFDAMWADDIHWFPLFLKGKKFAGSFLFDSDGKSIVKQELREVEELVESQNS